MKYISFFCLLSSLWLPLHSFSQDKSSNIQGRILDDKNQAISKATVYLLRDKDSSLIQTALSDKLGVYQFERLSVNKYIIQIVSEGYEVIKKSVLIEQGGKVIVDVILTPMVSSLGEVVVTGKKNFIEFQDDKVVVNVESSIINSGATAIEILERSPGVAVNQDGAISLRGKDGVLIMIDGKLSPLSSNEVANLLRSIPSQSIDKIEIITNPSAKYDASGNSGVINIRLKKDQKIGFNGSATLSYGQGIYPRINPGVNYNYRTKKLNLFGNYSYAFRQNFRKLTFDRDFKNPNGISELTNHQETYTVYSPEVHTARSGIDFFVSPKTVIGVMGDLNTNHTAIRGISGNVVQEKTNLSNFNVQSTERTANNWMNYTGNINFKTQFSKTAELTADADYFGFDTDINANYQIASKTGNQPTGFPTDPFSSVQIRSIRVTTIKAEYNGLIASNVKMETGMKSSTVDTDNDITFYTYSGGSNVVDIGRTNRFLYKETIHAGYFNVSVTQKKSFIQAGLRFEQTIGDGLQKTTNEVVQRKYAQLFPSLTISQSINEKDKIVFSYSRRINRPQFRDLNPFRDYIDPFAYNTGNVSLLPALSHNLQITHNFRGVLLSTIIYNHTLNYIATLYSRDANTKIQEEKPFNFDRRYSIGVSFTYAMRVLPWLQTNTSANFFKTVFYGLLQGGTLDNVVHGLIANTTNNITLKKGYSIEVSGNYRSKVPWGTNQLTAAGSVNMGVSKNLLHNNATIRVNVADIFYTQNFRMFNLNQNPTVLMYRRDDTRVATITFTYRFGKKTVTQSRNRVTGSQEETNRIQ